MWGWLSGPLWSGVLLMQLACSFLGDPFYTCGPMGLALLMHLVGLPVLAACLNQPSFRRCFEGRCLLAYWCCAIAVLVLILSLTGRRDLGLLREPLVVWPARILVLLLVATIALPPLRFMLRLRREGWPGVVATCWLTATFGSWLWILSQFRGGMRDFARSVLYGGMHDWRPWRLHAVTLLLLMLAAASRPLLRHPSTWAALAYWAGTLLVAHDVDSVFPEVRVILFGAMLACGLIAPLALLPRWWQD
jgi:hypothetical protein